MTATVTGRVKSGKLELLEEPKGLRDGRVRVTIEEEPERRPAVAALDRRGFLRLPMSERRRILEEQADKLAAHYKADGEELRDRALCRSIGRNRPLGR